MSDIDDEMTQLAVQILTAQPFSQHVGAEVVSFSEGEAVLGVDIKPHHLQQYGLVHGGMFGYLADVTIAFVGGSVLGPSVLSTGFTVDLLGNVRDGRLVSVGRVLHATATQAVCSVEVRAELADGSSKVCAVAQGTVVVSQS